MAVLKRLFVFIWGDDVDRALRPVLATGFAGAIAFSAGWSFMGIWAIKELGAGSGQLGVAYLAGAFVAGLSGYAGGHLSDHIGRRPLILVGWGGSALYYLLFLTAGHTVYLGLGLMAGAGILGALGGSSTQAMVADLVHPERREAAYASVRVAQNLGVVCGPPIGSLFLIAGGWHALFIGVSCLSLSGFLVILNPAMVTFFQLRLTRRVSGISPAVKLGSAMLLMGLPFLLLSASAAVPVVLLVIFVFVIGEMLWVPTSQSLIATLAPADIRGAYMGAFGSTGAVGFALAPFLGLQVRGGFGDSAMWGMFAAISVVGAVAGVVACRGARGRPLSEEIGGEPAAA